MISSADLLNIPDENYFEKQALQVFHYQYKHNKLYKSYVDLLKIKIMDIQQLEQIPFMPISFFKTHFMQTGQWKEQVIFRSSGTAGAQKSQHLIKDIVLYQQGVEKSFNQFYGDFNDFAILALLPSYVEREDSSLVYMVNHWMRKSNHPANAFYLNDLEKLKQQLLRLKEQEQKVILMGVSFALLDFAEQNQLDLSNAIIIETGGMKGKREELTREQLHQILREKLSPKSIHSEYGMTELLSQAYAQDGFSFQPSPWMKILIRQPDDPFGYHKNGQSGAINIIDLLNVHSCSFIATDDIGKRHSNGNFEVLGRLDQSDIRGCNLMIE